jgi:hypothetical protein
VYLLARLSPHKVGYPPTRELGARTSIDILSGLEDLVDDLERVIEAGEEPRDDQGEAGRVELGEIDGPEVFEIAPREVEACAAGLCNVHIVTGSNDSFPPKDPCNHA